MWKKKRLCLGSVDWFQSKSTSTTSCLVPARRPLSLFSLDATHRPHHSSVQHRANVGNTACWRCLKRGDYALAAENDLGWGLGDLGSTSGLCLVYGWCAWSIVFWSNHPVFLAPHIASKFRLSNNKHLSFLFAQTHAPAGQQASTARARTCVITENSNKYSPSRKWSHRKYAS